MNDLSPDIGQTQIAVTRAPLGEIPVIDVSPIQTGVGKTQMAEAIHAALSDVGFMYVSGHGVDQNLIDAAYEVSKRFFELPKEVKEALHIAKSGVALHGYTPFFEENNDPDHSVDFKEVFDLGRPAADGVTRPFFGPTPWPVQLPELKDVMQRYHSEMLALAHRLMAAIALSLGLPEEYFVAMMQEPVGIQRLLHYPPQSAKSDDNIVGIGAHTDYGCLTILSQDQVGGLQVLSRTGHWIDAPYRPGTFVVNIGDMLQRLTNDTYIANLHRVTNKSGQERYSIPCFFDVDFDTVFEPLDICVSADNPAKYTPIVCGEHKWARYVAAYPHLSEATP